MKTKFATAIMLFVFVTQAQAVCRGASCQNKDPTKEGCGSDAETISVYTSKDIRTSEVLVEVQLRYSKTCKAFWGKAIRRKLYTSKPVSGYVTLREINVFDSKTGAGLGFPNYPNPNYFIDYPEISSPMIYPAVQGFWWNQQQCAFAHGVIASNGVKSQGWEQSPIACKPYNP